MYNGSELLLGPIIGISPNGLLCGCGPDFSIDSVIVKVVEVLDNLIEPTSDAETITIGIEQAIRKCATVHSGPREPECQNEHSLLVLTFEDVEKMAASLPFKIVGRIFRRSREETSSFGERKVRENGW